MSKNLCVVTYTTIDNEVRTATVTLPENYYKPKHETFVNIIAKYIEIKQWPKEPFAETIEYTPWGLCPYNVGANRNHSNLLEFFYESHFFYYAVILKGNVISQLAMECSLNYNFGKAILKAASVEAQKKDNTSLSKQLASSAPFNHTYSHKDALTRAKNRIRYHRNKEWGYHDDYFDFARIIEEFQLFTINKIQLCT